MNSEKQQTACCLQRFNCCIIPFVATFICFGLFTLIIVASKLEDIGKDISWKEATLIGNAFRIDSLKVVVPILRRCDGPELKIQFYTSENKKITNLVEILNSCGSSLSNWLNSSPIELSLNYLNAVSDDIHAIVTQQDFVHLSIIDSQNTNFSSDDIPNIFTVCILPNNNENGETINISPKNITELAAFFESWTFYQASQFIFYDFEIFQNNSEIFSLYNNTKIMFPFMPDKKIIDEKFKDANLFYIYDCFYRSRFTSQFIVLTTANNIPMVHTRSSLTNILSTISTSLETENLVYQIFGDKSEEQPTQIFDGRLINGFDDKFVPIFKEESGKVIEETLQQKNYFLGNKNSC
uniref:Glycosyltransferase family 92 protein n=1 Tax=Panagrolaimus sp. PS1159 TaxID=55785 RepID=A0AC35F2L8_9BILA